ncbi:MAG: sulfatase-like hydrolase/transferase [Holophagales bacterium]|nr:sulfatase-like hydrolase/transferase [Holophagales bacterium]
MLLLSCVPLIACVGPGAGGEGHSRPISLVELWPEARVENGMPVPQAPPRSEIRWDGGGLPGVEWKGLSGVADLRLENGRIVGRATSEAPVVELRLAEPLGVEDDLWSAELRVWASAGSRAAVHPMRVPGPSLAQVVKRIEEWPITSPMILSRQAKTYTVVLDRVFTYELPLAKSAIDHVLVRPTNEAGAEFAIESVRFVFRSEHLASIPSGPGWQGIREVFRESVAARPPEALVYELALPERPWLHLAVGIGEAAGKGSSCTFRVRVSPAEAGVVDDRAKESADDTAAGGITVAEITVADGEAWKPDRIDLGAWAGRRVQLRFEAELTGEVSPGEAVVLWGAPTIRSALADEGVGSEVPGRVGSGSPRAVVVFLADTLRSDHLEAWGYHRETAPTLSRLATEGVRFQDAIAQATWTKASVSSLLTSLYPSTTGVTDLNDRVSVAETTLAEAFRAAGYATFATSSVPFTGQLTNLHQGVELLYEFGAAELDAEFQSKSSGVWVDRYLEWLELHRDVPTFALVHVMDPHSPFRPEAPWDTRWASEEDAARFAEQSEQVRPHIEDPLLRRFVAPTREELLRAGVDEESFVHHQKSWYDGSIRGLDENLGRLVTRLEALGLEEDSILAFVSDHGEEFLEHGQHWHGQTVYGEVTNVPLVFWGEPIRRLGVPAGRVIDSTVQNLDLMPTLLELAGLPIPERVQGRSLVPLMIGDEPVRAVPAFSEQWGQPEDPGDLTSFAVVKDGWKLVWYPGPPEARAEFELYDHRDDPLNLRDLAGQYPERVDELAALLRQWRKWAEARKLDEEEALEGIDAAELERLRSLGYVE